MVTEQEPTTASEGVFGVILEAYQRRMDGNRLRAVLGSPTASTLDEVARAFGASPNTVKQSWRSAGMPGSPGRWPLVEILEWRAAHVAPKAGAVDSRQAEADARKTELQVEQLELKLAEEAGRLIDREVVGTAIRSVLAELAESAITIGDEMETMFPLETAKENVATIRRMFERLLKSAAEKGARAISK